MRPAIQIENLGKRYRIGRAVERPETIREAIAGLVRSPFSYLQQVLRPPTAEDTLWAVRGVNATIQPGEAVGIIGRNGSGKSTLLKILSRITEPTEGRAVMRGRTGSLLEVGTGFHGELTGRENIYLSGTILGMRRREIDARLDEIIAFSEIDRFIDTPVKRYSSGMYTRLAFAVAAHLEPEILIVDEVLAVGDAAFQRKCLGRMQTISQAGRTVLFVSHNMSAVQNLCNRIIWLKDGQVIADGEPSDIASTYLQANLTALTEQTWDDPRTAPGNNSVRIHRVAVQPSGGQPADSISMRSAVEIEVQFWSHLPSAHLDVTLHLTTEDGVVAFGTNTGHSLGWDRNPIGPGLYRSTCLIPSLLLNTGIYRVMVRVVRNHTEVIVRLEDMLMFDVQDVPEMRGYWYGRPIGAVRPLLQWTLEPLDAPHPHAQPEAARAR